MHAAIDPLFGPGAASDPRQLRRVAAGIAVSLALHALLLSLYRQPRPAPALPDTLTVRLQPAGPAAAPAATVPPQAIPRQATPPKAARRVRPARPVIAVPPESRQSARDTYAVDPAPPPTPAADDAPPSAGTAPAFDIDAARSMARKLANEPDPTKAGTALERLPPKPLETESRLARGIQAAKRGNCKDGIPGGLLAPLYLMMEKKDTGCKW